jgi:YHS domain-containing protein
MQTDPICGMQVDENTAQYKTEYKGNTYYFCAPGCKKIFDAEPEKYLKTGTSGIRISSIIIALLLLTLAGVYLLESGKPQVDLLGPRVNSEAGIKITLTYSPDISDTNSFDLKVTAHTDYNDDFKNNSYLRDPDGKIYKPISYEGTGGHHASGTLRFQKIESKRFDVVIQDVADVKERIFKW